MVSDLRPRHISSPNHLLFFLPTPTELLITCPKEDIIQKSEAVGIVKIQNWPGCKISSRMILFFTNGKAPMATLNIKKDIVIPAVVYSPPIVAPQNQSNAMNAIQLMANQVGITEVKISNTFEHNSDHCMYHHIYSVRLECKYCSSIRTSHGSNGCKS